MDAPEWQPAIKRVIVDSEELLWVESPASDEFRTKFMIIRPNGVRIGEVELPGTVTVTEIGETHMVGVRAEGRDASVVVYRIRRNSQKQ